MMKIFSYEFLKQVVVYGFSLLEGFLTLRVILKIVSYDSDAVFVRWVFDLTQPLVTPFEGMFVPAVDGMYAHIEFSTVFGMLMYAILGYAVLYFIEILSKD